MQLSFTKSGFANRGISLYIRFSNLSTRKISVASSSREIHVDWEKGRNRSAVTLAWCIIL
jgi:hypothetical protein